MLYIGFALFFPQQERSAKSHELNTKKRFVWVRGLPDLACGSQDRAPPTQEAVTRVMN